MLRIIKFALPLVAIFCFGTLGPSADAAGSKKSSKSRSSSASVKKNSTAKKSSKARSSSKASKAKSKQRSSKGKQKAARESAPSAQIASLDWIDELPEVELPEASGPPEDELLEPVPESSQTP